MLAWKTLESILCCNWTILSEGSFGLPALVDCTVADSGVVRGLDSYNTSEEFKIKAVYAL